MSNRSFVKYLVSVPAAKSGPTPALALRARMVSASASSVFIECGLTRVGSSVLSAIFLLWRLGVIEDAVRIPIAVLSNELVDAPRFLCRRGRNRYIRIFPIRIERVDFRHGPEIEPNSN